MGNLLDSPKIDRVDNLKHVSSTGLHCAGTGIQGWRIEMEDTHVIVDMPTKPDHLFVAVFDGHGGKQAAIYAEKHIVNCIENTKQWKDYVASGQQDQLAEALIQAYLDIDDCMRRELIDTSGCTAVSAMVTPDIIMCANAGDSRCVLGFNGQTKNMSEDHKPTDEIERKRIEKAGGCVQWKRVDGDLAVSRAMADFSYKQRDDLRPDEQKVSVYPDIKVHQREKTDEVLILACDGVWDVYASSEAVQLICELYSCGETDSMMLAEELVDMSLNKGSRDNISAVIVKLPGANIGRNGATVAVRRERRLQQQQQQGN